MRIVVSLLPGTCLYQIFGTYGVRSIVSVRFCVNSKLMPGERLRRFWLRNLQQPNRSTNDLEAGNLPSLNLLKLSGQIRPVFLNGLPIFNSRCGIVPK
jgi:hypothetical protein